MFIALRVLVIVSFSNAGLKLFGCVGSRAIYMYDYSVEQISDKHCYCSLM